MIQRVLLSLAIVFVVLVPRSGLANQLYAVSFKVNNTAAYGAVQFSVNYNAAPGAITGYKEQASCTANASLNAVASFWNVAPQLNAGLIKSTQMSFPAVMVTCFFDSTGATPVAGNFSITLVDWNSTTTSTPPTIIVSSIVAQ